MIACCAALAAPGAAAATTKTATTYGSDEQLTATGSLFYTWQASPALGCAADGLCGVQGATIVDVSGADFSAQPHFPAQLSLQTTATSRTQGPSPVDGCTDVVADFPQISFTLPGPRARGPQPPGPFSSGGGLSGRCPGPLESDLARLTIPVRRHGVHRPSFDLQTVRTADAGPYLVTLRSTLVLVPSSTGSSLSTSVSGGPTGPARAHRQLVEQIDLRYRLAAFTGALQARFTAAAPPLCNALGACGTSGTVSLSLTPGGRELSLQGSRFVRHRRSRAAVLADLRSGRLSVYGQGTVPVTVSETIRGTDGSVDCTDTRTGSLLLQLSGPNPRGLQLIDAQGAILRTYCPGPANADLLPGFGPFSGSGPGTVASGSLSAATLARPQTSVSLSRASRFSGPAFSGSWSGSLTLPLSLVSLRADTVSEIVR
jgi:hypothetical protein